MTKKRGKGEGCVYKRADGRWSAVITVGYTPEGKQIRRSVYGPTKTIVTERLTRLQNERLDGSLIARERLSVASLTERWLTSWMGNLRPLSVQRYRECVTKFINPAIGGIDIGKVRPAHIRGILDSMAAAGKGARQQLYAFQTARRVFNVAVKLELITRNPCASVDAPKVKRRQIAALTPEQANGIMDVVKGSRWECLFLLAMSTGMRMGELFALAWDDVDLERGVLTVRHSLEEVKGVLTIKEPKSASGRRAIRLDPMDVSALVEHRKRLADEGMAFTQQVFVDTDGGLLRQSNFSRCVWYPVREAVGIDHVRFHDLRHSAASFMLRAGIHPKIASERLGHSTIRLTLDTYSHLLPDSQNEAAGAFHRSRGDGKPADSRQIVVKMAGVKKNGDSTSTQSNAG